MSYNLPAYVTLVHPMYIDKSLCWDLYYLTEGSTDLNCIRIYNIELSFMLARLPGLNISQFTRFMEMYTKDNKNIHLTYRSDLRDASHFTFKYMREYAEMFSKDPFELKKLYDTLNTAILGHYERLELSELEPYDQLFYKNTETPFRYTSTSLNLKDSIYNLPTHYGVPLIGGIKINKLLLDRDYPQDHLPNIPLSNIKGLNANSKNSHTNDNIKKCFIQDENVDLKNNMTMLAYDIETYNPDGNLDPTIAENYIFAIGIGFFNLTSPVPNKKICLLSKSFSSATHVDNNSELYCKKTELYGHKALIVKGEYIPFTGGKVDHTFGDEPDPHVTLDPSKPTSEESIYIFTKDEADLLSTYITVLETTKPQVITGFNTFGFDDNYMWERMKRHHLEDDYLQQFSLYTLKGKYPEPSLFFEKWFYPFKPVFRQFDLKIDNEKRSDNKTIICPFVKNVDVYKLMLKEDPKRFTQYGKGNLDTMLAVYNIKNPFTGEALSKTGLKIHEMYRRWTHNENLHSIAQYCCQDAWITGTLLITRAKLSDLIEMATISNTQFHDSLYRADGTRVSNTLLHYAREENFALMDTPWEHRSSEKEHTRIGGKTYDTRTIVGGAVRNIHAGRQWFVVALDYSAMYPANKEACNVDSSSRVDEDMIKNPGKYGLKIVRALEVNDMYTKRERYYIKVK